MPKISQVPKFWNLREFGGSKKFSKKTKIPFWNLRKFEEIRNCSEKGKKPKNS